jgi:hypothetical protein
MPAASNGIIQLRQERLDASLQAAVESVRLPLAEKGAVVAQELKAMAEAMREAIQRGFERKTLLNTLANLRPHAERGVEFFQKALPMVESDQNLANAFKSHLSQAKNFLAWIVELESRAAGPFPPFDESRLSEAPSGPIAPGYLTITEARARIRVGIDANDHYCDLVEQVLGVYTTIPYSHGELTCEAVFDRQRNRFVLMTVGWDRKHRVHFPVIHIDIIGGKLWIQTDNTDFGIATELHAAGVPKSDIVLAFRPPEVRKLTEYAVA